MAKKVKNGANTTSDSDVAAAPAPETTAQQTGAPPASALPIFYSTITMISRVRDRNLKVPYGVDQMQFCANAHLCPALAIEFPFAATEFPIVFLSKDKGSTPVFLFGLKPNQNLFVSSAGRWLGGYVPRYFERFPFILADIEGGTRVLAIEESRLGLEEGQPLFDDQGASSPFLTRMMEFSERYAQDALRSDAFVSRAAELDLFRSVSVEIKSVAGNYGWTDLMAIDEAKLRALPDETLLSLARSGDLATIYAHLISLRSFAHLKTRADDEATKAAPSPTQIA